ncbi:MAG: efflux RND transporter permease subunit [bacterium JZ-2024 1]
MSALARICIQRPIFTLMMSLALLVLGGISYSRLGVDLFPNVDFPVVVVTTVLPGAGAEEIETSVTRPLEEVINTIEGIEELRSTSREGISQIIVRFKLYKKSDVAAQEVRDRISPILRQLPEGTEAPIIQKFDPHVAPILTIAVSGKRSLRELTEISDKLIKPALETLPGVGDVQIVGGHKRAITIYLHPDRLRAYGISPLEVKMALASQNMELPTGRLLSGSREMVLRTAGRLSAVEQLEEIIIRENMNQPIRIRDVARVEDGMEEPRSLARLNGKNAVLLQIRKKSGTNTVQVAETVKRHITEFSHSLPPDLSLTIINDNSRFIVQSMNTLKEHFLIGGILVVLVVLLFMGDLRSTLIAAAAIPSPTIATFIVMYLLGYTLNNMTLLGLLVALGILIDDAIIILENIYRHMTELGKPPVKAAIEGTSEIALAVMATTFSLVVIFIPVAFMGGIPGRFFRSFGITIAVSILFSLFVSFTLTPMMCSRFLRKRGERAAGRKERTFFARLFEIPYERILRWSLHHRWVIGLSALLVAFSLFPLLKIIGKDFLPSEDRNEFSIIVQTPEGSSLQETDHILRRLEERVKNLRGVTDTLVIAGDPQTKDVTSGSIYLRLVDLRKRDFSQQDVMREARKILQEFPEIRASVEEVRPVSIGGRGWTGFTMDLLGPDLQKLMEYSSRIAEELKKMPGVEDVDTSLAVRNPEVHLRIDRDRAGDLGLSVADIALNLRTFIAGEIVSRYKENGELYDIWLKGEETYRSTPEKLYDLLIPSRSAGLIPLASVATLSEERGPAHIDRKNRQRLVSIFANVDYSQTSLSAVIARAQHTVQELNMPIGYQASLAGYAQVLGETLSSFLFAFILSLIFMYMILASQFESFLHPITILLALPVTLPFGIISLLLLRENLSIFGIFGLFILFGVVKKNGILQIDYTNTLRARGLERDEAVIEANMTRLRPILMTTFSFVAAMVPIALGTGPGSMIRASIGKVIIGGQLLSLLLSLLVTPVAYTFWDDIGKGKLFAFLRKRISPAPIPSPAISTNPNPSRGS